MTIALHSKSPIKFSFAPFGLAALAALVGVTSIDRQQPADAPTVMVETVTVKAGEFSYRAAGDFSRDGMQVDAPLLQVKQKKPLAVMRSQVTEAQYAQCVRENACRATGRGSEPRADVPVVNVSWEDATAYAQWLSAKTGETWRLPTDQEWAFAAGSRVKDDVIETTSTDFGERWIAKYEKESARARVSDAIPRRVGTFGANENGVIDVGGNVWEWTDTCFIRQTLDGANKAVGDATVNCGVRTVQGAHRAYVSNFIRDARGGGCSSGTPPDNLGFRLVRDEGSWLSRTIAQALRFGRSA